MIVLCLSEKYSSYSVEMDEAGDCGDGDSTEYLYKCPECGHYTALRSY